MNKIETDATSGGINKILKEDKKEETITFATCTNEHDRTFENGVESISRKRNLYGEDDKLKALQFIDAFTCKRTAFAGFAKQSKNSYHRRYRCRQCEFFTVSARDILHHRRQVHNENISIFECKYCTYASEYTGKVERHFQLRHRGLSENLSGIYILPFGYPSRFDTSEVGKPSYPGKQEQIAFPSPNAMGHRYNSEMQQRNSLAPYTMRCVCSAAYAGSSSVAETRPEFAPSRDCIVVKETLCSDESILSHPSPSHVVSYLAQLDVPNAVKYQCALCGKTLADHNGCLLHVKEAHYHEESYFQFLVVPTTGENENDSLKFSPPERVKPFGCAHCTYVSFYRGDVYKHQARKHDDVARKLLKFEYPCYKSSNLSLLKSQPDSLLKVPKKSNKRAVLAKLVCDICKHFHTFSSTKLYTHRAAHKNLKPFKCSECGLRANYKSDVQKHIRNKHHTGDDCKVIVLNEEEASSTIESYILSRSKRFANLKSIASHKFEQSKFRCSLCGFNSMRKWIIVSHVNSVHNGTKEAAIFTCNEELLRSKTDSESRIPLFECLGGTGESLKAEQTSFHIKTSPADLNYNRAIYSDYKVSTTHHDSTEQKMMKVEDAVGLSNIFMHPCVKVCCGTRKKIPSFKKWKCCHCFYRTNWKGDLMRHIEKEHRITKINAHDMHLISEREARKTYYQYEHTFGKAIRSRIFKGMKYVNYTWEDLIKLVIHKLKELYRSKRSLLLEGLNKVLPFFFNYAEHLPPVSIRECDFLSLNKMFSVPGPFTNLTALAIMKPFMCIYCGYRSNWKSDVLKHLKICHLIDGNGMKLLPLAEATTTIEAYEGKRTHQVSGTQKLMKLAQIASGQELMPIVVRKGTKAIKTKKPFRCSLCPRCSYSKAKLRPHAFAHGMKKGIECSVCSFASSYYCCAIKHCIVNHNGRGYVKRMRVFRRAYLHSKKLFLKNTRKVNIKVKGGTYYCEWCLYTSRSRIKYMFHRQRHLQHHESDLKCRMCSYSVSRNFLLNLHLKNDHSKVMQMKIYCPVCEHSAYGFLEMLHHCFDHINFTRGFLSCNICGNFQSTTIKIFAHHWLVCNANRPK